MKKVEITKYVVQVPGTFFGGWLDEKILDTFEEAKAKAKEYKHDRYTRIVKRTEEVFSVTENKPPKPKFKVGDLVRPEGVTKKEYPTLVGKITGIVEDSYWNDGHRWNYNLDWNDPDFPDWNGCREYELVRTSLPF
jgi:hypothetical protein